MYFEKPNNFTISNVIATNLNTLNIKTLQNNPDRSRVGSAEKVKEAVERIAEIAVQVVLV